MKDKINEFLQGDENEDANDAYFSDALNTLKREKINEAKNLKKHLNQLNAQYTGLIKKLDDNDNHLEEIMRAALNNNKEGNLEIQNNDTSIVPDDVIRDFLTDTDDE